MKYRKSSEFKYIIWYEEEGKGSIKNAYGVMMWYKSKRGALDGAQFYASKDNKNVLIQKGLNVTRIYPNGHKDLVQGDDQDWI